MTDFANLKTNPPSYSVELVTALSEPDLNDLCDATDAAIEGGGGFGWVHLPSREILERYWQGVVTMPARDLFVARLDGVICGTCQLVKPPQNNEAQGHTVHLTTTFVTPWARGHGLARKLVTRAEESAREDGYSVINLDVRETLTEAISLYESMGYERFGTHPDYVRIDGQMLKGFYYMKTLS